MAAYLVLLFAALSRCLPHWMHTTGMGLTASGAGLIFFGSRMRQKSLRWQILLAVAIMACTDYYLTVFAYGFSFEAHGYILTWAWYAALMAGSFAILGKQHTALRVIGVALGSSTGFFLLSNAESWWGSQMYPHTMSGLMASYAAGLPFYRNDALSTLALCGILFGVPVLMRDYKKDRDAFMTRVGARGR